MPIAKRCGWDCVPFLATVRGCVTGTDMLSIKACASGVASSRLSCSLCSDNSCCSGSPITRCGTRRGTVDRGLPLPPIHAHLSSHSVHIWPQVHVPQWVLDTLRCTVGTSCSVGTLSEAHAPPVAATSAAVELHPPPAAAATARMWTVERLSPYMSRQLRGIVLPPRSACWVAVSVMGCAWPTRLCCDGNSSTAAATATATATAVCLTRSTRYTQDSAVVKSSINTLAGCPMPDTSWSAAAVSGRVKELAELFDCVWAPASKLVPGEGGPAVLTTPPAAYVVLTQLALIDRHAATCGARCGAWCVAAWCSGVWKNCCCAVPGPASSCHGEPRHSSPCVHNLLTTLARVQQTGCNGCLGGLWHPALAR